jgi:multidrug resistance efflux pump
MSRAGRVTGILGTIGVITLVTALTGTRWLTSGGPAPPEPIAEDLDVVSVGWVDVPSGLISLTPAMPGRVLEVKVREGDEVCAGQVLVRLDDRQARIKVEEAENRLDAARHGFESAKQLLQQHKIAISRQNAAVAAADATLNRVKRALERARELARSNLTSSAEVDSAQFAVQEAESAKKVAEEMLNEARLLDPSPRIKQAEAEIRAAEKQHEQALQGLSEFLVKAPRKGKVLRLKVAAGEILGMIYGPMSEPPIIFCPDEPLIVRAEIDQEFASLVKVGMSVTLEDDSALEGHKWTGTVMSRSGWMAQRRKLIFEPGQINDIRTLECVIAIKADLEHPLVIGQRLRVRVHIKE